MTWTSVAGRAVIAAAIVLFGQGARATECGDFISSNFLLEKDLTCETSGLIITADSVTIDLNGFTITGIQSPANDPGWAGVKTQQGLSLANVRVKNGTIDGFDNGVAIRAPLTMPAGTGAVIEDMTFFRQNRGSVVVRNSSDVRIANVKVIDAGPMTITDSSNVHVAMVAMSLGSRSPAIVTQNSADVSIRAMSAFGPDITYMYDAAPAVMFYRTSNAIVESAFVNGFRVAVDFQWTSGAVRNSVFVGNQYGISLDHVADMTITGNHMSRSVMWHPDFGWMGAGISGGWAGPLSKVAISNNSVTDSVWGIELADLTSSRIEGNIIANSWNAGISVSTNVSGSFGNKIESNIALDNRGIDAWDGAGPNGWEGNICRSAAGAASCALASP